MWNLLIFIGILLVLVAGIIIIAMLVKTENQLKDAIKTVAYQRDLISKIQTTLKNKSATNAVAENSEMIYQDLLQNLIPIMAALSIMPRSTSEHPLWRALGGIMDEYAKTPFTLENLRRCIKLNPEIARNVDNYINRADNFLQHLTMTEPNGILTKTFTDGLLGQSLTFFTQAKQLAMQGNN